LLIRILSVSEVAAIVGFVAKYKYPAPPLAPPFAIAPLPIEAYRELGASK
jgi:hypothetical protein